MSQKVVRILIFKCSFFPEFLKSLPLDSFFEFTARISFLSEVYLTWSNGVGGSEPHSYPLATISEYGMIGFNSSKSKKQKHIVNGPPERLVILR